MGFVSQMHEVPGVLGVATYVASHSVKIYYNPDVTDESQLINAIFSPVKYIIAKDHDILNQLKSVTMGIERFFDKYDSFYLTRLLEQVDAIYGFETKCGEPVIINIYYDDKAITPEEIKNIIESEEVTFNARGKQMSESINFKVKYISDKIFSINDFAFRQKMFEPYKDLFYDIASLDSSNLIDYRLWMPDAVDPEKQDWLPFLSSHLTLDMGIVSFETGFDKKPFCQITYDTTKTDPLKIFSLLRSDSLEVMYEDGTREKLPNPFNFPSSEN